ncbi:hypothetical protein A2I98_09040 [Pseudoalteromonas agarivorans]|uniref:GmrSD restriction endonucleases N-terminal domain-containing protein n=1 Tax=Pseudoalteromonas agarivorans TaxID=176102 RepID=A0ABR5VXS0_9GAMM|nr:DUF262 domain-containing protein [Pseudoalteromonas telluritireducens]KYL34681.1 hypothetical protein A2I98_09040 [Pseudoalteromonas telluritireducens]
MIKSFSFDNDYEEDFEFSSEDAFSKITSYSISYNIATLIDLIQRQELELEPEFQRNFVWDKRTASLFIDSLLIGFPTPNLFFGRNSAREDFIVIDGLQRLKTIYFFITEQFSNGNDFRLVGLDGRSWDGKSYKDLPLNLQRRLMNSMQNATIIDDIDFNPEIVHELFYRINTGGIPLTNQEVRNCVYTGSFNSVLHRLNTYPAWRDLLGSEPHIRLADIELILRIMALIDGYEDYRPPMSRFLSYYQSINRDEEMRENVQLFEQVCDLLVSELESDRFRSKGVIKRNLLETVFVALGICIKRGYNTFDVRDGVSKFSAIIEDNGRLRSATTSTAVVRERIDIALDVFRG